MLMTKTNEKEVLSKLRKLSEIVSVPTLTRKIDLAKEVGLPDIKIQVLSNEGLLTCTKAPTETNSRAYKWHWTGPKPNIYMARKLIESKAPYPKLSRVDKASAVVEEKPTADAYQSIKVRRIIEVTKKINGHVALVSVEEIGDGKIEPSIDLSGVDTVEHLKCFGWAFIKAAEELSK